MESTLKPQFTLDQLYSLPFKEERVFHDNGEIEYRPIANNGPHSGIDYLDQFVGWCAEYPYRSLIYFGCEDGFSPEDLNSFVRILTGMSSRDFCNEYKLRCIEDYLRYTDLPVKEIIKRCGQETLTGLSRIMKKRYNTTYSERRRRLRQPNDVGRYR